MLVFTFYKLFNDIFKHISYLFNFSYFNKDRFNIAKNGNRKKRKVQAIYITTSQPNQICCLRIKKKKPYFLSASLHSSHGRSSRREGVLISSRGRESPLLLDSDRCLQNTAQTN